MIHLLIDLMLSEQMAKKINGLLQKWDEANFNYIDVIISSGEIRRLFFQRCKELQVDVYRMAMQVGINPTTFKRAYVDVPNPTATKRFPQKKFLDLLEIVGINIRVTVIVDPVELIHKKLVDKKIYKVK
jgi:aminopeptidase C